jgi:hypothetical protein
MNQIEPKGLVIIIGVLDKEGSTNIPMALSLVRLGFNVIPVNYRTIIGKYGPAFFASFLNNLVINSKADLVLVCKGNGIEPALIAEITSHTKTWIFNMDPKQTIDMVPEVRENARIATFSSCTAMDMVEDWAKVGANCGYIVQGLDEQIFRPRKPVKKYKADISLIGSRTPQRDHFKQLLESNGYKVKFYGRGYSDKEILEVEFAKVCSSSKYMLSTDSVAGVHTQYFSNRLVRYLGCGACTLHFEPTGTLEEHFQDGEHLFYFKDETELLRKLNILKKDKELAYRMAMGGMDRVLKDYTWDRVMGLILNIALPEATGVKHENTVS